MGGGGGGGIRLFILSYKRPSNYMIISSSVYEKWLIIYIFFFAILVLTFSLPLILWNELATIFKVPNQQGCLGIRTTPRLPISL